MGKALKPRRNSVSSPSVPSETSLKMRKPHGSTIANVSATVCGSGPSIILTLGMAFSLAFFTMFVFMTPSLHSRGNSMRRDHQYRKIVTKLETEIDPIAVDEVGVEVFGFEIVREFQHDSSAFTQGLVFDGNNTLYESTGLYRQSSVREVDLLTGKVYKLRRMDDRYFGEGLTIWHDRLVQVLWQTNKGFIYDKRDLRPLGSFSHPMKDGWGLTANTEHIIGSDGSSKIYFINPNTFQEERVMTVKDEDEEVSMLNELEYIKDEIWANIWMSECIARISPVNGQVMGWILLHGLRNTLIAGGISHIDVLNGIAWDKENDRIYVTGKLWPKLYEIKLSEKTNVSRTSLPDVRKLCRSRGMNLL